MNKEIVMTIHFIDKERYVKRLKLEQANEAQVFLEWYRSPRRMKVWSWDSPDKSKIEMFQYAHIVFIELNGYIELKGRNSYWYERIADKLRSFFILKKLGLKGGENTVKDKDEDEDDISHLW